MPRIVSDKPCEKQGTAKQRRAKFNKGKTKINPWHVVCNCDNVIQIGRKSKLLLHSDGFRDRDRDVVVATD